MGEPLIPRATTDENFAHCITLLAPTAAWAESLQVGHIIEFNDLNMIALPVEIALAFVAQHEGDDTPIGAAARKCAETLALFRSVRTKPGAEEARHG